MNSDIEALRSFAAVAELGSFREAGLLLNLSQPALSRRVQKLEERLGVALLKRGSVPGPSGEGVADRTPPLNQENSHG